jgi:threonine dehydrogenase-like Zn-dependent dehydrogenase
VRGFAFRGDRQIAVVTKPTPVCGPCEVLVRIRASAVCGSDLHYYRQSEEERRPAAEYFCGHEPVGVIEAVGCAVSTVAVGDRVVVYHVGGCGTCHACTAGRFKDCPDAQQHVMQRSRDGANAEFVLAHERQALPLPNFLSFEEGAVLACNFGTAWGAINQLPIGSPVLAVWGLGPVGMNVQLIARTMGLPTVGIDISAGRREIARRLGCPVFDGADPQLSNQLLEFTGGAGFDAIIETTGSPLVHRTAPPITRRLGTIVLVGLGPDSAIGPTRELIMRELSVKGSWIFGVDDWQDMLEFVDAHQIDLMSMVDRVTSIEHFQQAIVDADHATMAKIVFRWPADGLPESVTVAGP